MKETFYFPHDNNAHNDPKLMSLFMQVGLSGIGLFWILIEMLHQQKDGTITREEFTNYIEWYGGREQKKDFVQQVLNTFLTSSLFIEIDGKISSKRVLANKNYRDDLKEKRSLAGKKSAEKRASLKLNPTSVEQNGTNAQQGKEKERKGKEKEKKVNIYREFKHLKLTQNEFDNIIKKYTKEKIDSTLDDIENYKKNTSYTSLNLTVQKWLRIESEKNNENKKEFEKKGSKDYKAGF